MTAPAAITKAPTKMWVLIAIMVGVAFLVVLGVNVLANFGMDPTAWLPRPGSAAPVVPNQAGG